MEQASDLDGKYSILQSDEQEFEMAIDAMRDAMVKFSQPDQDIRAIVLCDYAYAAYNLEVKDRNKFQAMVTDFIDDLVDKRNQSGTSDAGYWNSRPSYRR